MKKGVLTIVLLISSVLACGGQRPTASSCDLPVWEAVAGLYSQAVSNPEEFPEWLEKNRDRYPAGGVWERCGRRLAEALMKMALTPAWAGEIDEHAASVAGKAGAPQLGPQVAESMKATANDTARLGAWLAEVLQLTPGLLGYGSDGLEDELARFDALFALEKTDVFRTARLIWSSLSVALSPTDIDIYRGMLREMNVWLIIRFGQALR